MDARSPQLAFLAAMCLTMQAAAAQTQEPQDAGFTLTTLAEIHDRLQQDDTQNYKVNLQAHVNFWDRGWKSLFVQDGEDAVFVELPSDDYSQLPDLALGDILRIRGTFNPQRYVIYADVVEQISKGEPASPLDFDLDEAELGAHWSRRVQVHGRVESSLVNFGRMQLIVQNGSRRFFVRDSRYPDSQPPAAGSQVKLTGTLAYFTDENDQAVVAIVHQMPADELIVLSGPEVATESLYIADYGLLKEDLEGGRGSRFSAPSQRFEVHGQVTHGEDYKSIIIENTQGQSLLIYAPFQDDLHAGDVVRITGIRGDGNGVQGESLHPGRDQLGRQADLLAQHIQVVTTADLSPPPEYTARQIVEQQLNHVRAIVRGRFRRVEKGHDHWRIVIGDQDYEVVCELPQNPQTLENLNLERAAEMEARGVVQAPSSGVGTYRLLVSEMENIRITREQPGIDYTLAAWIGAGIGVFLFTVIATLRIRSRRRERALTRLAAQLESTQETISEGLLVVDSKGRLIETSPRLLQLLDITEDQLLAVHGSVDGLGALLADCFQTDAFAEFWAHSNRQSQVIEQQEFQTHESTPKTIMVKTTPVFDTYGDVDARIWVFDDVTSQKQLESTLLHSQKMDAVGQMVGGVAHDFNNMLASISANLQLLSYEGKTTEAERREFLDNAETACSLAADLAKNLLSFSRKSELELRELNVNDIVQQMGNLLSRSLDSHIIFQTDLKPGLRTCLVDRNYLIQALLNICLNARDALGDERGTITVSTCDATTDDFTQQTPLLHSDLDPCDYLRIRVQDDGEGVPRELQDKIFEPFFTTKPEGSGTGIGLATSRKLIRQHGGDLLYCSGMRGACFDIFLPATHAAMTLTGSFSADETSKQPGAKPDRVAM